MSDDVLKLIPTDPAFLPGSKARERAVAALKRLLPRGEMCSAEDHGRILFIDQGANLEAVICPSCTKRLQLWDSPDAKANDEWWQTVADHIEDAGSVESVAIAMPCCGSSVGVVTLRFEWPAGFSRFELSIWNPQISRHLSPEEVAQFEAILGCSLRQIRAHY